MRRRDKPENHIKTGYRSSLLHFLVVVDEGKKHITSLKLEGNFEKTHKMQCDLKEHKQAPEEPGSQQWCFASRNTTA